MSGVRFSLTNEKNYHHGDLLFEYSHPQQQNSIFFLARKCNLHSLAFSECEMMSSPMLSTGHEIEHWHKIIRWRDCNYGLSDWKSDTNSNFKV